VKPLVIDVEGDSEGHVFNYDHKLYMLGLHNGQQAWQLPVEWFPGQPYGQHIQEAQKIIDDHDLIIAFNLKHDLLWSRRYGINLRGKNLWCCQYAEFCISGQTWRMPDLNTAAQNRGLEGKINWDWSAPFNTYPWADAAAYNARDLEIEFGLFQKQVEFLKDKVQLKRLIWNGCQDLGVTAEMEWNGLKYDHEKSLKEGNNILGRIRELEDKLRELAGLPQFNSGSPRHVSALLFGGTIEWDEKEPFEFIYKNPKKPPITKFRTVTRNAVFPRLVEPLNGSANTNGFSTEEGILKRLKATGKANEVISVLLDIRGLDKLVGTYYHGIPKLALEMNWQNNILHGQLHHCVTGTGRLSSSKPNQQNLDYEVRTCLVTRFPLKSSQSGAESGKTAPLVTSAV
jgi:DNA polymerase-1